VSHPPLRIGLTGGIGSGKSLVAEWFRELGAAVVDADLIAREVMVPGQPAYDAVVRAFGQGVLGEDGTLDRKALAARIFTDTAARWQLNALTHPYIRRRIAEEADRCAAEPGVEVIIVDIPLLFETTDGRYLRLDGTVVVDASDEVRLARLSARDGLSPADTQIRLEAQMPLREKVTRADWVIDNNGSVEATRAQVEALWKVLLERLRAH